MFHFLFLRYFRQIDWLLLGIVLLLVVIGLTAQYSVSLSAGSKLGDFYKQAVVAIICSGAIILLAGFDFRLLRTVVPLGYFLLVVLLVFVLFFGQALRGVKGWLGIGPLRFQVVEMAKILVILVLARFWQNVARPISFWQVIKSFILVLPVIILVLFQPDFGSAIVLFFIWLGTLFLINRNWRHYLILLILIMVIAAVAYTAFLKDYQKERILVYLNPGRDPLGHGYQINQAKIAIGSGKLLGRGFAYGPQSQLRFLPARKTDFIFAVIGEEFGLIGSLLVVVLFFLLFRRIINLLSFIYDNFGLLIAAGILINLFIHFFFNIGMNLGLLPVVGLPLPFMSYGGSALVVNMVSIGLIESIIVHQVLARKIGEV